jgi:hypothetical protein
LTGYEGLNHGLEVLVGVWSWEEAEELARATRPLGRSTGPRGSPTPAPHEARADKHERVGGFFAGYPETVEAFHHAGLFSQPRRKGRPIPSNEMRAAASALQHPLVLFAPDLHFGDIEGLLTASTIDGLWPQDPARQTPASSALHSAMTPGPAPLSGKRRLVLGSHRL